MEEKQIKACITCQEVKNLTEFNNYKGKKRNQCKLCHRASVNEWQRKNKEAYNARHNKWCKANPIKRKRHIKNYENNLSEEKKVKIKERHRWWHIKKNYNLTKEDWFALYEKQNGLCALCKKEGRVGRYGNLDVDHCHETGRVRGLLCGQCNISLGILGDTPKKLQITMDYLQGEI